MSEPGHGVSFRDALRVWTYIGLNSFGGPAGQIAVMHRVLVEQKRWIGEARFLHALNYCMLLPGPEATQLAVYIGWLLHRTAGGLAAGILFVLPGVVCMMALSVLYVTFADLDWVKGLFYGLTGAVVVVVVEALLRISKRALKNRLMVALAAAAFVAIHFLDVPFPAIVGGAALIGLLGGRYAPDFFGGAAQSAKAAASDADAALDRQFAQGAPEHTRADGGRFVRILALGAALWLAPTALAVLLDGAGGTYGRIGIFFSEMAVVTFGGAYAVLAYVAQQAVETHHWLSPEEMLYGLGLAETTPGPLIMVLQFVGFLAGFREGAPLAPMTGGIVAGLLATWATFAPSFVFIFAGAPYVEAIRGNKALGGALAAITAAVVGVVLNLAVWFAAHALFAERESVSVLGIAYDLPRLASVDWGLAAIAVGAAVAMFRFHAGMMPTLGAAAAAGVLLKLSGLAP